MEDIDHIAVPDAEKITDNDEYLNNFFAYYNFVSRQGMLSQNKLLLSYRKLWWHRL